MEELLDDGVTWRDTRLDPANDPALVRTQEALELEARQAKMRARLQALDGEASEDAARRHLADRLKQADDDFTRQMLAAAKEDDE
jgi:hypothetical protein